MGNGLSTTIPIIVEEEGSQLIVGEERNCDLRMDTSQITGYEKGVNLSTQIRITL